MATKIYDKGMEAEAIDPKKVYTLKEIRDLRLIPFALHYQTLKRIIGEDFMGANVLQAIRMGEGRRLRYHIKGDRIIKYINNYALSLMRPVQKSKHGNKI